MDILLFILFMIPSAIIYITYLVPWMQKRPIRRGFLSGLLAGIAWWSFSIGSFGWGVANSIASILVWLQARDESQ